MKKNITIPEIAKLANVSIGTVDRAINDRPGINPKTKERILKIAQEHNYSPNRLSRAMASKKTIRIGVITLPTSPFVDKLTKAVYQIADELKDYGCIISVHALEGIDASEEARFIKNLTDKGCKGLAIGGFDDPIVGKAINDAVDNDVKVVTFNTDVANCKRTCFVGQNLLQSGMIAADLLCRFIGGKGKVFILQGSNHVSAHRERLRGFNYVVDKDFPRVEILSIQECLESNKIAYKLIKESIISCPDISGVYVVASGTGGTAKGIIDLQREEDIMLVCNDFVAKTGELLKKGIIDATILQDPKTQGQLPVKLLFEWLFDGNPPLEEYYYTHTEILTKHLVE